MNWIVSNRLSMAFLAPELMLGALSIVVLLWGAFFKPSRRVLVLFGLAAMVTYVWLSARLLGKGEMSNLFAGMVSFDMFAIFFKIFAGSVTLVIITFLVKARELEETDLAEALGFLFVLTIGMSMMAASTDLLMIYLSLEMVSVLSYILVGYRRHSRLSSEAGLKYILYGAASSGVMIFGLSYLFGLVGSTDMREIALYFRNMEGIGAASGVFFILLTTMVGFGYKIATFPTQMWCPDVYEGAALPVTAFLSVGPKAAGFAMTMRFFLTIMGVHEGEVLGIFQFLNWPLLIAVLAAFTMTIGNLAALQQRNMKRLMAYSSIAHAGYLLMGFATLTAEGVGAILFYLITYFLMNLGTFLVILIVGNRVGSDELDGYRGLGWRSPLLAVCLAVFLFSLTGLPPLAGFIGKVYIFAAVIHQGIYWLAVVGVLNTVISLFYYVRVVKVMYLEAPTDSSVVPMLAIQRVLAVVLLIPIFVLGVYWEPILAIAAQSANSLF